MEPRVTICECLSIFPPRPNPYLGLSLVTGHGGPGVYGGTGGRGGDVHFHYGDGQSLPHVFGILVQD
jgi:hypothetical protein